MTTPCPTGTGQPVSDKMEFRAKNPPRKFLVKKNIEVEIADCGEIVLAPDEQVTFVTPGGGEYDVARKSWGFYATPSINSRLVRFGFRTALVRNDHGQYFVMLVEKGMMPDFEEYIKRDKQEVVEWLSDRGH